MTVVDDKDTDKVVSIFFTFYFTFFLILGQSFTAGLFGFTPMTEKKMGLRQMMHMSGLSSFEYFTGIFMGDWLLFICPAIIISLCLLGFDQIMVKDQIGNFFISYILFGFAVIQTTYLLTHLFDDPETGNKYIALIFVLGFFIGPIAISMIFAAIFGFDSSVGDTVAIWFWFDPTLCFILQLYTLCCVGKPDLKDLRIKLFSSIEVTTGLYVGVILAQIVVLTVANIMIDRSLRNRYRVRGGADGAAPPMLDVRQDVVDHEREVRENAHLLQSDADSY